MRLIAITRSLLSLGVVGLTLLFADSDVRAVTLLVSEGRGDITQIRGYGWFVWRNFTAAIDEAFSNQVTVVPDFNDLEQMLSHDALLLDLRLPTDTLGATEVANISTFAATGRRVLLMGDNDFFGAWNSQILAIVGGTYAGEYDGIATRLVLNDITSDVPTLDIPLGGTVGMAVGGTELYEPNFATMWKDNLNVLTVLDANVWEDRLWDVTNGGTFGTNVARWLAGVPEPTSALLAIMSATIAIASTHRRRR